MTDEAAYYGKLREHFAAHDFTRHCAGQHVDFVYPAIHTNTIEGAFSVFKRGVKGTNQHCAKKHLHRYVVVFEFRYTHRNRLQRSRAGLRYAGGCSWQAAHLIDAGELKPTETDERFEKLVEALKDADIEHC